MRVAAVPLAAALWFLGVAATFGQTAERTMFLLRSPEGATAIRAESFEQQGDIYVITSTSGSRAVVQATSILGQVPWHPDEDVASGKVDPVQLAATYEAAAARFPAARKILLAEAAKLRAVIDQRQAAVRAEQAAAEARLKDALSPVYEAESGYTVEQLEQLLGAAEGERNTTPDAGGRIDAWAAPFREHLTRLKAGDVRENGAWVTVADRERAAREAAEARFRERVDTTIAGESAPTSLLEGVVRRWVIIAAGLVLVGLVAVLVGHRWLAVRAAGVALFTLPPVAIAGAFFLATRDPGSPTPSPATASPGLALLAQVAGLSAEAPARLTAAEINAFLARHLLIAPGAPPDRATRNAVAVEPRTGGLVVFEMLEAFQRAWIVRYEVSIAADGSTTLTGARFGMLPCPKPVADALWQSLSAQLAGSLAATGLPARFRMTPADGAVELAPTGVAPSNDSAEP